MGSGLGGCDGEGVRGAAGTYICQKPKSVAEDLGADALEVSDSLEGIRCLRR